VLSKRPSEGLVEDLLEGCPRDRLRGCPREYILAVERL
jgi:hypothetical protein